MTDNDHGSLQPEREVFAASGLPIDLLAGQCRDEGEVIAAGRDAHAFLVQYAPITRRVLEACPKVRVVARYGFMEDPDVPALLARRDTPGLILRKTTFFLGRETLLAEGRHGMSRWREQLFAYLSRNAVPATAFFRVPPDRVLEVGWQIEL